MFLMLGRGLVHPVDFDHDANPPSHPDLLRVLSEEFAAHKYDMRYLIREIALSATYQRSSELPGASTAPAPPGSFAVASLKPLSPEQLAWSLMQATGLTDAERQTLGKDAIEGTFVWVMTKHALQARLSGNVTSFVRTFGSQPGQPEDQGFDATIDQTLFLRNGSLIRGWLAPRAGNLTEHLTRLKDAPAVGEELYLSILTRLPTEEEQKEVAECLQRQDNDRGAALQGMAWALMASAEFRFNH
jgi:hypothetical protein